MDDNLIFDIGLHIGQDTEFYLKKGFRVVAVEANPLLADAARRKFADEIGRGRLIVVDRGIADSVGSFPFFVNETHSSWSSFVEEIGARGGNYHRIDVETITMAELFAKYGIPYYMKIDIEGYDHVALSGVGGLERKPKYISVENGFPELLRMLASFGYRSFKFINQAEVASQILPESPREGQFAQHKFEFGSSGAFGDEAPGEWVDQSEVLRQITAYWGIPDRDANIHGWYDLHARLG